MNLKTGFKKLNDLMGDLKGGELVVIASRPGVGKSTFSINLLNDISKMTEKKILYFNLENSKSTLKTKVSGQNVEIIDISNIAVEEIKERCEAIKDDLSLVLVDYIQLVSSTTYSETRIGEISYISRTLKVIALELNIPVIALTEMSRQVEKREDKRPILRDLDSVGSLVQDADKVLFLYRENYCDPPLPSSDTEVIVAKNRNGELGSVKMKFKEGDNTYEE